MTHCDDYIDDATQPECLRAFLRFKRAPAIEQNGKAPTLFAKIKEQAMGRFYLGHWVGNEPAMQEIVIEAGQRVRVVMASRFGDVGITTRLQDRNGYMLRVPVSALEDFSQSSS